MKREELKSFHGHKVHVTYGGQEATGLLDAHDVNKACLKSILKNCDSSERADAHSAFYLTDQDIATLNQNEAQDLESGIHISDVSAAALTPA